MSTKFSIFSIFKAVDKITKPISRMQQSILKFTRAAKKGLKSVNDVVSKVGAGIASVGKKAALVAAGGVAALTVSLNSLAAEADALAKQSRRLQFPVEDLQEWKFVAEQSGVSTSQLDSALGAFSKRMGELKAGTGPLLAGLKKLNPDLAEQLFVIDDISEAFELYIGAMREAETATEKAALANSGFSRSGLNLVDISVNSADAIKKLRQEQRENGVITMKQAEAAEAYNDAVNSLKKTLKGFMQDVLMPMFPIITENIRVFRDWAVANRELITGNIIKFFKDAISLVVTLTEKIGGVVEIAKKIGIAIGVFLSLKLVIGSLIAVLTLVNLVMAANPITLVIIGIVALIAAITALVVWWDKLLEKFPLLAGAVDLVKGAFDLFLDALTFVPRMVMKAWAPVKKFFASLWGAVTDDFKARMSTALSAVDKVKKAVGKVGSFFKGIGSKFGFGGDDESEQTSGRVEAGSTVVSPTERLTRNIEETRSLSKSEVLIRDQTGRAEMTKKDKFGTVSLESSAAF